MTDLLSKIRLNDEHNIPFGEGVFKYNIEDIEKLKDHLIINKEPGKIEQIITAMPGDIKYDLLLALSGERSKECKKLKELLLKKKLNTKTHSIFHKILKIIRFYLRKIEYFSSLPKFSKKFNLNLKRYRAEEKVIQEYAKHYANSDKYQHPSLSRDHN